jgi:hypothetical protein
MPFPPVAQAMHAVEAAERRERALQSALRAQQAASPPPDEDGANVAVGAAGDTHGGAPSETAHDASADSGAVPGGEAHSTASLTGELAAERARVARRDAEIERLSAALEAAVQRQGEDEDDTGCGASDAPGAAAAATQDAALVVSLRRESDALRARVRELTNALAAAKRRAAHDGTPAGGAGSGGPVLALSVGMRASSSPPLSSDDVAAPGDQLHRQLVTTQAALERTRGERDAARRMLDVAVSAAQAATQTQLSSGDDGQSLPAASTAALQFALDEAEARTSAACDARDRALARAAAAEAALLSLRQAQGDTGSALPSTGGGPQTAVVAQLRSLLATADATREQLVTKLRASLAACHAAEQRSAQAQAHAQEAAAEANQLRALAAALADERDAANAQLTAAQESHDGLDALAATHGFAAATARDAAAVASRSMAEAREQAAAAARDCAMLRAAVADARAAADAAVSDAQQLRCALESATGKVSSARAEADAAVAAAQGAQAVALGKSREVDDVTEAFSQLSGEHATVCMALSAMQREQGDAHQALGNAQHALDSASLRLAELQEDNAALRHQLAALMQAGDAGDSEQHAALVARLRAAEARTAAAERAREECARDAAAAGATVDALRSKLDELVLQQHAGGTGPAALHARLGALTAERDAAVAQAADLQRQLDAVTASPSRGAIHGPGTPDELVERGRAGSDVSDDSLGHAAGPDLRSENAALRERLLKTEAAATEAAEEMERVRAEYETLLTEYAMASYPPHNLQA